MASHNGSQHYGSPARLDGMSSSSSRLSVDGSLRSISKYRIKVVAKRPLPNFNFLAPYEPHAPQALTLLQCYIHKQLSLRALVQPQKELMNSIKPESIRLEMDNFAIPLDEPEILRDGDVIEACLATESEHLSETVSAKHSENVVAEDVSSVSESSDTDTSTSSVSSSDSEDSTDESGDESESSNLAPGLPLDEREALLEGKRIAALLKAGVHQSLLDEGEGNINSNAHSKLHEDFPKPPAPSTSSLAESKQLSTIFPAFPPELGIRSSTGGAAAAMAAFEAQRKQSQARRQTAPSKDSHNDANPSKSRKDEFPLPIHNNMPSSHTGKNGSAQTLLEDSDSDSESDSAPSVEAIARLPEVAAMETDTVEQTVSPGKGTNRTKRRNQLRRKKAQLLRETENEVNFLAAKQRAEERERQTSVNAPAMMEDTAVAVSEPSVETNHKEAPLIAAPTSTVEIVIPRHGSVDEAVPAADSGTGKKRKRQEASPEPETVQDAKAELSAKDRYVSARTVPPSELPPDQVPACITILRVDCEEYYEAELRKLTLQQESAATEDTGDMGLIEAQLSQKASKQLIDLDYGEADTAEPVARKRAKVRNTPTFTLLETVHAPGSSASDGAKPSTLPPTEPEDHAPAKPWAVMQRHPPRFYIDTDFSHPFEFDDFASGDRVVYRDIALNPVNRLPEVMTFVAVVERCSSSSVELDSRGPLFAHAQWDELNREPITWTRTFIPGEFAILFPRETHEPAHRH